MIQQIKTDILDRKPQLKLKPNHFNSVSTGCRRWDSKVRGPAISDGKGWYKPKPNSVTFKFK